MTREELIKNLEYTMKKHENDRVDTFDTNISLMCKDMLDYLEQESCSNVISREDTMTALRADPSFICTTDKLIAIRIVECMQPATPQPCGDVISFKEDVLNVISRIGFWKSDTKEVQAVADCLRAVEALPVTTPQSKTEHSQKSCDTCEHSDEIDGSDCYECVKGVRDRYNPQPTAEEQKRLEENMSQYYKDCDYLNGENSDGIRYDNCSECYRYETCKKFYETQAAFLRLFLPN